MKLSGTTANRFVRLVRSSLFFFLCASQLSVVGGSCRYNWFGPVGKPCVYRCHCSQWNTCDDIRGTCDSRGCAKGFAGTGCQYVNVAYQSHVEANFTVIGHSTDLSKAVDGQENNCFVESGHQNLPLSVQIPREPLVDVIKILLFRQFIQNGQAANGLDLEVTYYNDNISEVLQPHLVQPNDSWVSYHLPQPAAVTEVQIRAVGNKSLALCEVIVLGGRNLAVKKNATQGDATYESSYGYRATADKAVDGNANTNFTYESCSHTDSSGQRSWWAVALGNNLKIWRVQVYNRQDYGRYELRGFRVNVTLGNGSEVEVYRHPGSSDPREVTDIFLSGSLPATDVTVWLPGSHRTIMLCEVLVFGDCVDGYYGWDCEKRCRCKDPAEICDKLFGYCPQSRCADGYRGDDCQQKCPRERYGFTCAKNCSATCVNVTCDHVTGVCTNGCMAGWEGRFCAHRCRSGYYGVNCSTECPSGCRNAQCHHVTGFCNEGCLPGWLGSTCDQSCDKGFFGNNCSMNCSNNCLNNSCNATSGHCLTGCKEGMMGEQCDIKNLTAEADDVEVDALEKDKRQNWVVVGAVIGGGVLLLLAVVVGLLMRRHRSRARGTRPGRQRKGEMVYENSETILLDSAVHKSGDGDVRGPSGNELGQHVQASPSYGRTGTEPKAPEDWQVKARTQKPVLMSIFSRDANAEPPTGPPDPAKPFSVQEENAPPPRFPKEGLKSSSVQSSPKSQRGTPTPVQEENAPPLCFPREEPASLNVQSSSRSQRDTPNLLGLRAASFESLDLLSEDELDDFSQPSTPPKKRRATGDSDYYNVVCRDTSPTTVIPLSDLPARVAQWLENPRHFSKERSMLPVGRVSDWKTALLPQNIRKNRYKDIYPYDQTRVTLIPLPDDPHSDYYNACYVDGYRTEKEYIAAQGPMERTLYDFLRMVWDVKCSRVVMLTNTVELGRYKCQQYWPDEQALLTSGDISVLLDVTDAFADYCIRHLTFERRGKRRSVTMYHYTAWPDNFAPASPWSLLDFRQKVRQGASDDEGPVIVHCSAGIGRTGTYLALDILLSRAQLEQNVDVFTCVWKLRQQRVHMVQTLAQYIFIHETLSASLLSSLPVPVKEFNLKDLLSGETGARLIDREYKQLQMCLGPATAGDTSDNTPPEMFGLPRDIHRVNILSTDRSSFPAYINAVFLSSYRHSQAFIQTHSPSETVGAVNFLSMVVQRHVTSIVSLDTDRTGTLTYWPDEKETPRCIGPYTVTLLSMRKARCMTVRNLRIVLPAQHDTEQEEADQHADDWQEVTHITCTTWPQSRVKPPTVWVLLDLIEAANPGSGHPVVVHCRDGHTRSGLFCIAAAMLERMREEGHVAVNYVTAHMRVPRRENIVNVEQYNFLYACAQHQINVERNITDPDENVYMTHDPAMEDVYVMHDPAEKNLYGNLDTKINNDVKSAGSDSAKDENVYGNVDCALNNNTKAGTDSTGTGNAYGNLDSTLNDATQSGTDPSGAENAHGNLDSVSKDGTKVGSDPADNDDAHTKTLPATMATEDTDLDGTAAVKAPATGENMYGNLHTALANPNAASGRVSDPTADGNTGGSADGEEIQPAQTKKKETNQTDLDTENIYSNV